MLKKIAPNTTVFVLCADDSIIGAYGVSMDAVYEDGRRVFLDRAEAEAAAAKHTKDASADGVNGKYFVDEYEASFFEDYIMEYSGLVVDWD